MNWNPVSTRRKNSPAYSEKNPVLDPWSDSCAGSAIFDRSWRTPLGNIASAKDAPPIAWVGGLLGAFFVTAAVTLVPRLGVAMTFSLIIAGQMLVTIIIDHFGLLGVPVKEISLVRVAGILLITAGVVLIRKF